MCCVTLFLYEADIQLYIGVGVLGRKEESDLLYNQFCQAFPFYALTQIILKLFECEKNYKMITVTLSEKVNRG